MKTRNNESGFSIVEVMVASLIFSVIVTVFGALFVQVLAIQRKGFAAQKVQENATFVLESIARELRVSRITSGDSQCYGAPDPKTASITLQHPVNGIVTYLYDSGRGVVQRNGIDISTSDVKFSKFAFCVEGSIRDAFQARVTIPATIESTGGRPTDKVIVNLQTTVSTRDVATEF